MTLHLVRAAAPPAACVAPGDVVLADRDGAWHRHGVVHRDAEPLTDEAVLDLVFAADRVVVW